LAGLTNLRFLYLNHKQSTNVGGMAGLTGFGEVYLEGNPIRGIRSWITIARIKCRGVWRVLNTTAKAQLIAVVTLFIAVIVALGVWARRVIKRYTREP